MSGKRSILFVLHIPPPIHGAAMVGKFIKESELIKGTFDADFINLSTSVKLDELGKGGIGKLKNLFLIQKKVIKALRFKKYDLVYMTLTAKGSGFYKDLLVVAILKLFNRKIIYHFHNKGIASRQNNKIDDLLYRFAFKNTKSILLSSYLFSDIKKYVRQEDIFYCANGIPKIDISAISNKIGKEHCCSLLFLSNMTVEKGVFVLLEACKILNEKKLNFECHFVGAWADIAEEDFIHRIESEKLSQVVFVHGKKYGEEKLKFFKEANVFVLPSFNEAFPLVNLEAMIAGLPVISTPEGGIPDTVLDGETGFIVPKKDAAALAEKLEVLIRNPELRTRMGMAGKKRFQELYTLENFEHNLKEILAKTAEMNF